MAQQHFPKDPTAILDYTVDWQDWLQTGETIQTSTWIAPSGITINDDSNSSSSATVWLSGGTKGKTYRVTNRIVTNQGRDNPRSIFIHVNYT